MDELRILVVDDDEDARTVLRKQLEAVGRYSVVASADAYQALAELRSQPFDLVLADVRMPGASGFDLLEQLDRRQVDVPVVLVTAAPSLSLHERARALGVSSVLTKPVSPEELARAVQAATRSRAQPQAPRTS